MATLTLPEFVNRWQRSTLTERSAAQSHFLNLCDVLGEPHPAAADLTDAEILERLLALNLRRAAARPSEPRQ